MEEEPDKFPIMDFYLKHCDIYGEEKVYEAQPGDDREKMEKILGDFFQRISEK